MGKQDDGGPAFPCIGEGLRPSALGSAPVKIEWRMHGMSLRDWFAGQALGAVAGHDSKSTAEACYALADAMLAERAKGKQ